MSHPNDSRIHKKRPATVRRRRARRPMRRFDPSGLNEVQRILFYSAVAFAVLAVALGAYFLLRPTLQLSRADRLARTGDPAQAEAYLTTLERDGRSPKRVAAIRAKLAGRYIDSGETDAALALVDQLPDGADADALENRARYAQAAALFDAGDYEGAARLYYPLGDYADAPARYAESRCAMAVQAWLDGDEGQARALLLDAEDAASVIESAALAVTKDPEFVKEILASDLFSSALQQMAQDKQAVSAARAQAAPHRLAAGYRHTLGLKSDGTVLAAGDNMSGQCDVSGWTDIVEVTAGASHSVGLRADGTVAAVGDNSYGQCDVADWTDIRAVAACAYGTFGLKSDGTVVATRAYADRVTGWREVTQLSAGAYSAGALYGQGSMACTHEGARLSMGAGLFGLSVCGPTSAALLPDGSLYANTRRVPAWHGLKQVVVSPTGMIGVFSDGACHGFTFRDARDVTLNLNGKVTEAASSGTHHVVLLEDGAVRAFGENGDGQCEVSGWNLG